MKKQLLINSTTFLSQKKSFRMTAFAVLTFLTVQSSFGQTWVGATSADFSDGTNWSAVPTFTSVDIFAINAVVAPNNNPVLNAAVTCATISTKVGSIFTTNADFTTGSLATSSIEGTVNINGGIWSSPKLYIGNASGGAGVVNVAGATLTGSGVWRLGSTNNSGTHYLNINNGGILDMSSTSALTIGFTSSRKGVLNVNTGGVAKIFGGLSISSTLGNGTINVAGGSLEYNPANFDTNSGIINVTAGSFKLLNTTPTINAISVTTNGVINIGGGTLDASGPLTIGHGTTTTAAVTVNLNSGTMNIAGALTISAPTGIYTGLVNIDAGSIVLDGDQTAGITTLVTAGRITVSGAALAAGKTISNTYDAGTGKTTVVAIAAPLGVNDVELDANTMVVYAQDKNIKIQSGNGMLSDVKVYDVTGRLVTSKKSIGSNEASIALDASNGVYLVKVTTADGKVVTKKVIQ
jgi:hypothetical protein